MIAPAIKAKSRKYVKLKALISIMSPLEKISYILSNYTIKVKGKEKTRPVTCFLNKCVNHYFSVDSSFTLISTTF